jgi:hypothetical protein
MGQLRDFIVRQFHHMKLEWMKRPVALLLSKAFVMCITPVSVVCIDTLSSNEFELGVKATT